MTAVLTAQREWARLGAHARLMAIESERVAILRAFPDLGRGGAIPSVNGLVVPKRRFSAAARRRMSAGMRKFWARRKADAAKTRAKSA
jgi:hypothetical protein